MNPIRSARSNLKFESELLMNAYLSSLPILLVGLLIPLSTAAANPSRLAEGDRVRDFELPIVGGDGFLRLSDEVKQGPVVVIVLRGYPGYQCGICNRQVSALVSRARVLDNAVQRVVLVYPGEDSSLERRAEQFMGSRRLPDPMVMVRDDGMTAVTEWGLRWNKHHETAYPATYVIDSNGRVQWAKVSESHAGRSSVEEILKAVRGR